MENLKQKTFSGMFWKFFERILAQGISFIVSMIIARILTPHDYGIVAIVLIFINIGNVFVSNGFNTALIQKKEVLKEDFSTIFYCSLFVAIIIYLLLYLIAPIISDFYQEKSLTTIIRVFSLTIPISSYKAIQSAWVARQMDFRKFFYSTLIGTIVSAIVGIIMALHGFGVWALIAQHFTNTIIDSLILTLTIKWKPQLVFTWKNAKPMLLYGGKVFGADLIGTIFNQLYGFVIGKRFSPESLAFYSKGKQIPDLFNNNISSTICSVLFPAFSQISDDNEKINNSLIKTIGMSSFILCPIFVGLFFIANNLILILLTEKWIESVIYIRIACLGAFITISGILDVQLLKAVGNSGLVLKLEFIKKPLALAVIIITTFFGVYYVAWASVIVSVLEMLINALAVRKVQHILIRMRIRAIWKSIISSIFMGICVGIIGLLNVNKVLLLFIQIITGIIIYIVISKLIKNDNYYYLLEYLKSRFQKKGSYEN